MTRSIFFSALCAIGGAIAPVFGGWDAALITLIGFMAADYVTGLIVAGIFQKSDKSENGGLESLAGLKGLFRKGAILLVVYVAAQLDILLGTAFVRNYVVTVFVSKETLSILKNVGLMGVPMLPATINALEVLKRKTDKPDETKTNE